MLQRSTRRKSSPWSLSLLLMIGVLVLLVYLMAKLLPLLGDATGHSPLLHPNTVVKLTSAHDSINAPIMFYYNDSLISSIPAAKSDTEIFLYFSEGTGLLDLHYPNRVFGSDTLRVADATTQHFLFVQLPPAHNPKKMAEIEFLVATDINTIE